MDRPALDPSQLDPRAKLWFGKYRLKTVYWVAKHDSQYLDWLCRQGWFVEKQDRLVSVPEQIWPGLPSSPAAAADGARLTQEFLRKAYGEHEPK